MPAAKADCYALRDGTSVTVQYFKTATNSASAFQPAHSPVTGGVYKVYEAGVVTVVDLRRGS